MQLYLRDAIPGDVDDLVMLLLADRVNDGVDGVDGLAHGADYADALREIEASESAYLLVADLGGRVVGMLQLFTFRHLQHRGGRCAEIESMRVAADVRGRGIGSRLISHAVQRAQELGCYRIQLTSNDDRADAHRFYETHGFTARHRGFKRYL